MARAKSPEPAARASAVGKAGAAVEKNKPAVAWDDTPPKRDGLDKLKEGEDETMDIDETGIDEGKIVIRKQRPHDDKVRSISKSPSQY